MAKERSEFQSLTINALAVPILELHLTWEVNLSGDSDNPLFSFSARPWPIIEEGDRRYGPPIPDMEFSAFKVQEEFFEIRTPSEAEALFVAYGPWQNSLDGQAQSIRFSDLIQIRKSWERALLSKRSFDPLKRKQPNSWLGLVKYLAKWGPIQASLQLQEPPFAFVKCSDIQESVKASVILRKIDGLQYRRCARKGCRKLFRLAKRYPKKYCSPKCTHHQAVIKYDNSPKGRATSEKRRARKRAETAAKRANKRRV